MKTVAIRYFASVREVVGTGGETLQTDAATAGALRDELIARGASWAEALARSRAVRVAVGQVLRDDTAPLADGDEVAFFPPVTGG